MLSGTDLPATIAYHQTVVNSDKSGFLTIGGTWNGIDRLRNYILELGCVKTICSNQWIIKGVFDGPRDNFVAFWIPSHFRLVDNNWPSQVSATMTNSSSNETE